MINALNSRKIDLVDYDLVEDILFLRLKGPEYEQSIDMGNLVLDLSADDSPIGIEIFNASKLFNIPKSALQNIKSFRAEISISPETIEIKMNISVLVRNKVTDRATVSNTVNDIDLSVSQTAMVC